MLTDRLGPLEELPICRLLLEIKRITVVRRSDICNQVRLMEATQEPNEPIRTFVDRLKRLAHTCNLYMECPNQYCTTSYVNRRLLLVMVKGLVDQEIRRELLSHPEEMDLEKTVVFLEDREGNRLPNMIDTTQEEETLHEPEPETAATNTFDRLYDMAVGGLGERSENAH